MIACICCGGEKFRDLYQFESVKKKIAICNYCEMMVLDPMPTVEELKEVYKEDYFSNAKLHEGEVSGIYGYSDYISERINKQSAYKLNLAIIKRYILSLPEEAKLLDYGCGLGHFLDIAYDSKYKVSGLEFNPSAIDYIRGRYTYHVQHTEKLAEIDKQDVITAFDVFEHLQDPVGTLKSFHEKLNPNGLLVISTMDSRSITSKILGKRLEDFRRTSEHLYFFSRKNITQILEQNGFDVLHIHSQGHSFPLGILATRISNMIPIVGGILKFVLFLMPFLKNVNIYLNPLTKMVVYARKRPDDESNHKLLSLVMPAYNEQLYVEKVVEKVLSTDYEMDFELVFVDDGSTDRTLELVEKYKARENVRVISAPHKGKGAAVRRGIKESRGDLVIIQDADLEYDPSEIKTLIEAMKKSKSIVVFGSRFTGKYRKTGSLLYTAGNLFLTFFTNLMTGLNLSDMETCYKLFNGRLIRSIHLESEGFEFEPEITCRLSHKKIDIIEAPITYMARTRFQGKKIKISDGFKALFTIMKFRFFNN